MRERKKEIDSFGYSLGHCHHHTGNKSLYFNKKRSTSESGKHIYFSLSLSLFLSFSPILTHTHNHANSHIFVCVCVCVSCAAFKVCNQIGVFPTEKCTPSENEWGAGGRKGAIKVQQWYRKTDRKKEIEREKWNITNTLLFLCRSRLAPTKKRSTNVPA